MIGWAPNKLPITTRTIFLREIAHCDPFINIHVRVHSALRKFATHRLCNLGVILHKTDSLHSKFIMFNYSTLQAAITLKCCRPPVKKVGQRRSISWKPQSENPPQKSIVGRCLIEQQGTQQLMMKRIVHPSKSSNRIRSLD
jgi:hypothetical protein